MQKFAAIIAMLLLPLGAWAQFTLSGTVKDQEGYALMGANLMIEELNKATAANSDGAFRITGIPQGEYTLKVTFVGYANYERKLTIDKDMTLDVELREDAYIAEEIIVSATRATEKSAMTYTEVSKKEIEKRNFGQDMPYLLRQTPSMVVTSDAGAGVGYTGMRIRGSDATRINVTVNGIPLNDAESHGVFWVNMPDFASSANNIQIQRGVGTSTNGAAAFGASIDIQTTDLNKEAYAEVDNAFGSFNTWRHSVKVGSGLINDKFTFDARLSKISSDGYVDRASSDLKSFFVSAGYYGESTTIKFNAFSGKEKTYQSWWGLPEDLLETDRTNNYYTYDNETDNYQQDHYQLILAQDLASSLTFNAALHYTYGRGYYEQYKAGSDFAAYGFEPVVMGDSTINSTDLIQRRWLDNDFYGFTSSLNYQPSERLNLTLGTSGNIYDGDHFGEVIWARFASDSEIRDRYYDNIGVKQEFNTYLKGTYQFTDELSVYGDLQYRMIDYHTEGIDADQQVLDDGGEFAFFNPKFGVNYELNDRGMLYASYSVGNREPVRNDFIDAPEGRVPKAETLYDLEAGYRHRSKTVQYSANIYWMDYKNQLVPTGELNDVGASLRTNVENSYRLGLELQGAVALMDKLTVSANATFSQNKIDEFTEVIYNYDAAYGSEEYTVENTYENTDISFSPEIIAGGQIQYQPIEGMELAWIAKYVGQQYLDNTSNENRALDAYFVNNYRVSVEAKPQFMPAINLALQINNVFNHLYEANGYTYSYIAGGEMTTANYYYPQAGTNFMLSASLKF